MKRQAKQNLYQLFSWFLFLKKSFFISLTLFGAEEKEVELSGEPLCSLCAEKVK